MRKSIYRKSAFDVVRSAVLPLLFTVVIIVMVVFGLRQTEAASRLESRRVLEDSIRRAVIVTYALEGRYPQSIYYIEERFGIFIDRERFVVHYQIFASNIFPDIAVIEL